MKRIVILTEHYFESVMGGAEQQISLLVPELLRLGYEVHYIYINYDCNSKPTFNVNLHPVQAKELSRRFGQNIFLYKTAICRILKKIKPDYIYQQSTSSLCGIAATYTKKNNCKLIWHIAARGGVLPYHFTSFRTMVFDYLDKKCAEYGIRNADYIVGQTKYQEGLLFDNYGKKCDVIAGNWHPEPNEKCNKELPVKVVWVANIKPHKQPEIFVDLAEKLQNVNNVEFVMIGRPMSGGYQQMLEKRISKLGNLKYLGEISNNEVNRLLSLSHILVSTSKSEGFSNTFIQAWMREVPVISLNVDPDDLLKKKGLGFHSGGFENLVMDTKKLINNLSLLELMGKRAKVYANSKHSLTEMNKVIGFFK